MLSPDQEDWLCRNVLPELAVFFHAVDSGSRKAAHEKLGKKTPEAVGLGIDRLQEALEEWMNGGHLWDHSRKIDIDPTEAGTLTLDFARQILAQTETFLDRLYALQHSNQVRVATIHMGWMIYGPSLEAQFAKRVPGGRIDRRTIGGDHYPEKILAAVREGKADIGITSYVPRRIEPLIYQAFQDQPLVLVLNQMCPSLPKNAGKVQIREVINMDSGLKFAIHRRTLASPLGTHVYFYLRSVGADLGPGQFLEGENVAALKENVRRFPNVVSILPLNAVRDEVKAKVFKIYGLTPKLEPWTWGLLRKSGTPRPAVTHFLECLRPLFKTSPHKP